MPCSRNRLFWTPLGSFFVLYMGSIWFSKLQGCNHFQNGHAASDCTERPLEYFQKGIVYATNITADQRQDHLYWVCLFINLTGEVRLCEHYVRIEGSDRDALRVIVSSHGNQLMFLYIGECPCFHCSLLHFPGGM